MQTIISSDVRNVKNHISETALIVAADKVNKLFNDDRFYQQIIARHDDEFEYSYDDTDRVTGPELVEIIKWYINQDYPRVYIRGFSPGWFSRFRRAYAYVSRKNHCRININLRYMNRSLGSLCGTVAHELIHLIDYKHPASFGHGSNSRTGKQESVPYWIGALVKEIINKGWM